METPAEGSDGSGGRFSFGKAITSPFLALLLGAAFWGGTWIVGRGLNDAFSPIALAFWRWAIVFIVLTPFCLKGVISHWQVIKVEWRRLFALSFLGLAGFNVMVFYGLQTTSAINGSLINAATPVYIILLAYAGLGTKGGWRDVASTAIALIGLVIIITQGDFQRLLQLQFVVGDLVILAAMLLWALYNVFIPIWPTKLPPFVFMTVIGFMSCLMLGAPYIYDLSTAGFGTISTVSITGLIYLGVFSSIGSYLLWNYGVGQIGATRASIFQFLIPAFAAIFAVILLGESVFWYHLAGAALIIVGIYISNSGRPTRQTQAADSSSTSATKAPH